MLSAVQIANAAPTAADVGIATYRPRRYRFLYTLAYYPTQCSGNSRRRLIVEHLDGRPPACRGPTGRTLIKAAGDQLMSWIQDYWVLFLTAGLVLLIMIARYRGGLRWSFTTAGSTIEVESKNYNSRRINEDFREEARYHHTSNAFGERSISVGGDVSRSKISTSK